MLCRDTDDTTYTQAATVAYFGELTTSIRQSNADPERLSDVAVRYSMDVLAPVPEGYV